MNTYYTIKTGRLCWIAIAGLLMAQGILNAAPIEIDFNKLDLDPRVWVANYDTGTSSGSSNCPVIMMPADRIHEVKVKIPENLSDWQECTQVTLRVFSPEADEAKIILVIYQKDGQGNWWKRITADWKGWKDIEVRISDFTWSASTGKKNDPKTFGIIDKVSFVNMWGVNTPEWAKTHGILTPTAHTWGIQQIVVD